MEGALFGSEGLIRWGRICLVQATALANVRMVSMGLANKSQVSRGLNDLSQTGKQLVELGGPTTYLRLVPNS
jgi:hypothetical protein